MTWNFDNDRPIYLQVMERMKMAIISGELELGSRMPGVRDLAMEASINPNTMQKALGELEREGLLFTQRTNGRFVTENRELIDELRNRLAQEKLLELVQAMERLGYAPDQLIDMFEKVLEERKDGK